MPSISYCDLLLLYAQRLIQTVSDTLHREFEEATTQLHHRDRYCHRSNALSCPHKRLLLSLHANPAANLSHRPVRDSNEICPLRTFHIAASPTSISTKQTHQPHTSRTGHRDFADHKNGPPHPPCHSSVRAHENTQAIPVNLASMFPHLTD
jgi:hypothetical protein